MKNSHPMRLNDPDAYREANEDDLIADLMRLKGRQLLELGCGAGWMTRLLAERFRPARILATEVDRIQLAKNLAQLPIPGVEFRYGGAETIAAPDASFDAVFMFKSLHHVPRDLMAPSLREIHRVLVPGGLAYFCEPVYWGDFNAVLSLVHDEREVREAAFEALVQAVESGLFALEAEIFFQVPGTYATWEVFADRFLKVTHTQLDLDAEREARIRAAFEAHLTPTGAHFLKPHRIDLLRKAG
jgi:SAM-dependent methyltransferase